MHDRSPPTQRADHITEQLQRPPGRRPSGRGNTTRQRPALPAHVTSTIGPSPARAEPHDASTWLPVPDPHGLPTIEVLLDETRVVQISSDDDVDEIDLIEINEAFASMAVYCLETLKIDHSKLNVRGGAIALGHPLGCTGARQIVTGLSECRRQKKKVLLTSMCIGTGMGMAGLFVNEQL